MILEELNKWDVGMPTIKKSFTRQKTAILEAANRAIEAGVQHHHNVKSMRETFQNMCVNCCFC